jgi:hypothetical protein
VKRATYAPPPPGKKGRGNCIMVSLSGDSSGMCPYANPCSLTDHGEGRVFMVIGPDRASLRCFSKKSIHCIGQKAGSQVERIAAPVPQQLSALLFPREQTNTTTPNKRKQPEKETETIHAMGPLPLVPGSSFVLPGGRNPLFAVFSGAKKRREDK